MTAPRPVERLVTFGIGAAWFAVAVAHVERVLRHEGVFAIPGMPDWMEGILEYRGGVVPVVDLGRRFGIEPSGVADSRRLLMLSLGGDLVAAAVDRVVDVRAVLDGELSPPPPLVRGVAGDFLRGVVRRDDTMVLVLDVLRLLGPDDQRQLEGCLAQPVLAGAADGLYPAATSPTSDAAAAAATATAATATASIAAPHADD